MHISGKDSFNVACYRYVRAIYVQPVKPLHYYVLQRRCAAGVLFIKPASSSSTSQTYNGSTSGLTGVSSVTLAVYASGTQYNPDFFGLY